MPIFAAGELWPVEGQATPDKLGGKISSIGKETFCDEAVIGEFGLYASGDDLPLTELDQGPFGLLTPWVVEFGRVYSGKANSRVVYDNGVAIDHPASAAKYGIPERR